MLENHPSRDAIRLENVLAALGNPMRMAVVALLAQGRRAAAVRCCKAYPNQP